MGHLERQWAAQEFGAAKLGDARRTARLVGMAVGVAQAPGGKVSEVFRDEAEQQGAYDFLESTKIQVAPIESALSEACARRAANEAFAFVSVDGCTLSLVDRRHAKGFGPIGAGAARGIKVVSGLALDPKGTPLGLTAQKYWARPDLPTRTRNQQRNDCARRADKDKETQHWVDVMAATLSRFDETGAKAWVVADREADARTILLELAGRPTHRFTIRSSWNRRLDVVGHERAYLRQALQRQRVCARYKLHVPASPKRAARTARMHMRVLDVKLRLKVPNTRIVKTVHVSAVWTQERGTNPVGEKPLDWLLLTNVPVRSAEDATSVLLSYTMRWRVEEMHKAWKSGACQVEQTQLRSKDAVIKWATILAAVATRVERLKLLARSEPEAPASIELSSYEIRALILLKREHKKRTETVPDDIPTIAQATRWIADLGGYTGKSSGGPPGSITIGRGFERVRVSAEILKIIEKRRR